MLGGLYGDLPPPSSTGDDNSTITSAASVCSSSAKMAHGSTHPPQTLSFPQTILKPQQSKPKPSKSAKTQFVADENTNSNPNAALFHPALVSVASTVIEEYDPARPNDYEDYCRQRKRKQAEAEMRRELEERERREREESERRDRERDKEQELYISGEEAWRRRAAMSGGGAPKSWSPPSGNRTGEGFSIGKSESGGLGVGAEGKMTAAQRMMAKMGWEEGQGLGKQKQGITIPLVAKKTDMRAGVIVNASESNKKIKSVNFNCPPTRVVLLGNMFSDSSSSSPCSPTTLLLYPGLRPAMEKVWTDVHTHLDVTSNKALPRFAQVR